ncbi:uncharacterized protein EAF01_006843 [Botrytis porri]|uniref:N-acetyltransferase domain-containing protein n=1 Tax=Botrytis porri TaxID=87229 RepID=A0A4Z1KZS9_9HELO|nr:uncharacterized protein EAF01_006843 [Botrytis porri]KAF7903794.1 hypothetical protein EAF01_006843 [Botrytis porri]TGO89986.1 hypothetical protein BPOR_0084g00140 [Botrytis porri]
MAPPPSKPIAKSRIREAEPKDIEAIRVGMIASLSSDPPWRYRYINRDKYPEDLYKYSRLYIELMVCGKFPDYLTMILEVEEDSGWKLAALSIWDASYVNRRMYKAKGETYNPPTLGEAMEAAGANARRDIDPIYNAAFLKAIDEARKEYTEMFNGDDFYLHLLGTHPDFRRRGYATQLLKWGIERSTRDNAPLVLSASAMGEPTYLACGFEELGRVPIVVDGDYEKQEFVKMVYRPRN